jgi:methylphosphotriester-DNA--protein-cysteine methyltransferase
MKRLLATILLAGTLCAETVYFTPAGKTYHGETTCAALARSKNVLRADKAEAEKHGLTPCKRCYRATATPKPKGNAVWAQAAK